MVNNYHVSIFSAVLQLNCSKKLCRAVTHFGRHQMISCFSADVLLESVRRRCAPEKALPNDQLFYSWHAPRTRIRAATMQRLMISCSAVQLTSSYTVRQGSAAQQLCQAAYCYSYGRIAAPRGQLSAAWWVINTVSAESSVRDNINIKCQKFAQLIVAGCTLSYGNICTYLVYH